MDKKVILFTLQSFSTTGGVQKMARTLSHSLFVLAQQLQWNFEVWSLYDKNADLMERYVSAGHFHGFGHNRLKFSVKILLQSRSYDTVILSHINLALVGVVIKALNPKCQVVLVAHGIEVWRPLSKIKNILLKRCDQVICVSNFTRKQIINLHKTAPDKCVVLNNAVDPFIKLPEKFLKPQYLLNRYGLTSGNQIVFTLTRLAYTEQYKGYEQVIKIIHTLKKSFPAVRYVLAGKYDELILTGFINESELTDHFLMADFFVLPSKKEGFGIVFIEALACGLPVISGNADGSNDAVRNGELGKSINADDPGELLVAMTDYLQKPMSVTDRRRLQSLCLSYFNEKDYIQKLKAILTNQVYK
jgi:glycosyltransferase involved in cell wall biosynthesis